MIATDHRRWKNNVVASLFLFCGSGFHEWKLWCSVMVTWPRKWINILTTPSLELYNTGKRLKGHISVLNGDLIDRYYYSGSLNKGGLVLHTTLSGSFLLHIQYTGNTTLKNTFTVYLQGSMYCCVVMQYKVCTPYPIFGVLEIYEVRVKDAADATQFYQPLLLLWKPVAQTHLALLQLPDHLLILCHMLKTYILYLRS